MKKGLKVFIVVFLTLAVILTVAGVLLVKNSNRIIKHELDRFLGKDFSVEEIRVKWNEVEAVNVSYKNSEGKIVFRTDTLTLSTNFIGLLNKDYTVSSATLKNPYLFLETDDQGHLKIPFRTRKEGDREKPATTFRVQKIQIENGSLDYLDRKPAVEPVLTEWRNIDVESDNVTFPLKDNFSDYRFTARISGKLNAGTVQSQGKVNMKTLDMDAKVNVRNLDMTHFKPYFQKKGDVNIKKGFLDLDMDMKIHSGKINAPGRTVMKELQFDSGQGLGNKFLNIPLSAVVAFLKKNNQLAFDFTVEGDIDNPQFNLRENLVQKIAIGLADHLGFSITRVGESIVQFGAEGTKNTGKGMKDIGEDMKKIIE
jgi:hypothetical protein